MTKFKVVCDPNTPSFGSTQIIVNAINKAAKNLDLYSDNDKLVVYDCLGQSHGYNPNAFWTAYELPFPGFILQNCYPKKVLGLSKDNAHFAILGGYPRELVDYVNLGVDTKTWRPTTKKYLKDKFVFLTMTESNTRSGLEILIQAFAENFKDQKGVALYLKDRSPTDKFQDWVKNIAETFNVEIIHDPRHLEDHQEEVKIFESCDCHFYLNHTGSFNMTVMQGLSCGIPTVSIRHGGPSDYISHRMNGIAVEYDLVGITQEYINQLIDIGMKNHLFPITNSNHKTLPFWAVPRKEDMKNCMNELLSNKNRLTDLSENAIATANWFSWERSAMNMSFVLRD